MRYSIPYSSLLSPVVLDPITRVSKRKARWESFSNSSLTARLASALADPSQSASASELVGLVFSQPAAIWPPLRRLHCLRPLPSPPPASSAFTVVSAPKRRASSAPTAIQSAWLATVFSGASSRASTTTPRSSDGSRRTGAAPSFAPRLALSRCRRTATSSIPPKISTASPGSLTPPSRRIST